MAEHKKFWIVNQLAGNTAEILIYGEIGTYGKAISASDFVKELKGLEKTNSTINLRINSGGGSVYEGIAIFNAIRNSKCTIIGYIDGIAASMASLIAMACKKVYMSKYARFMTHLPSGGAWGNANELREVADEIDALEKIAIKMYQGKTGLSEELVKAKFLNGKDNYFGADDALKLKLIDDIYDGVEVETPDNITDSQTAWEVYNTKLQMRLNPGGNSEQSTGVVWGLVDGEIVGFYPKTGNSLQGDIDTINLQKEIDRFKNVPGAMTEYLASLNENTPLMLSGTTTIKITDETNYEDIPNEQRKTLRENDCPLYCALYWLEYDIWPGGLLRPEIDAAEEVVSRIKTVQLPVLRKMSLADLKKEKKLNRLKHLDLAAYNRKCGYDNED